MVFRDVASLRDGLKTIVEVDALPKPVAATKVAFACCGEGSQWVGMGQALYESEPVVRAVLDRCDAILREGRSASLLDVIFGRADSAGALDDPAWTQPALYALECALAALWSSVGIRPSAVLGQGVGELAAAQMAGVFGLDDGLRLAAARGAGKHPETMVSAPPSFPLVSSATGRVMEKEDATDEAYWQRRARDSIVFDRCLETLAELGVQAVVEIGPDAALGPLVASAWPQSGDGAAPPVVLSSLRRDSLGDGGFVEGIAGAYEAGLEISFAGLFAGEARCRISLPAYPFQRRHHWIEARPDSSSEG